MGAEMSKLSARISMHVPEYSLKLSRPFAHHNAAFSIVVVGNQIVDSARRPICRTAMLLGMHISLFGVVSRLGWRVAAM
jgi:hypothetical protein